MKEIWSFILAFTLVFYSIPISAAPAALQNSEQLPEVRELLNRNYVDLFEGAPQWNIPESRIKAVEKSLEEEKDREEERLELEKDAIEDRIERAQEELKRINKSSAQSPQIEEQRHRLHCRIQESRQELEEIELALEKGLDIRFDNQFAKLKVLEEWPARYREIQQAKAQNKAFERKFSDFRDVGFRGGVFEDQEDDVKKGRQAIEQLKRQDMLPPEVEDEEVTAYMTSLAQEIARHSDLAVPLKLTVLKSKEINAFALPGGFLFVNSELIMKAASEAELAGVVAHEIAHAAARHGNRLMGKANIANILFQTAQLAALILTGGAASLGTYYALQYGFYGLGLVLSLSLLGVSRDFEVEADILGTQYLWHSGYDTAGFVKFFATMAEEEGYVTGLSWFRTHPPFYERMKETFEEISFLPPLEDPITDTSQFRNVKKRLEQVSKEMEKKDREAPTLRRVYDCEGVTTAPSGK